MSCRRNEPSSRISSTNSSEDGGSRALISGCPSAPPSSALTRRSFTRRAIPRTAPSGNALSPKSAAPSAASYSSNGALPRSPAGTATYSIATYAGAGSAARSTSLLTSPSPSWPSAYQDSLSCQQPSCSCHCTTTRPGTRGCGPAAAPAGAAAPFLPPLASAAGAGAAAAASPPSSSGGCTPGRSTGTAGRQHSVAYLGHSARSTRCSSAAIATWRSHTSKLPMPGRRRRLTSSSSSTRPVSTSGIERSDGSAEPRVLVRNASRVATSSDAHLGTLVTDTPSTVCVAWRSFCRQSAMRCAVCKISLAPPSSRLASRSAAASSRAVRMPACAWPPSSSPTASDCARQARALRISGTVALYGSAGGGSSMCRSQRARCAAAAA
mmetsp:Transcript_21442/g.55003  ORF Transcript_21442/g.55003 Transcript_21442/m.55003 type:complete len:381 (-) Transcript_21442:1361-2503(-)